MANIYVESASKSRSDDDPIDGYVDSGVW